MARAVAGFFPVAFWLLTWGREQPSRVVASVAPPKVCLGAPPAHAGETPALNPAAAIRGTYTFVPKGLRWVGIGESHAPPLNRRGNHPQAVGRSRGNAVGDISPGSGRAFFDSHSYTWGEVLPTRGE